MPQTVATPDWLLRPEAGLCPCGCIGKRRRESFVAKTIAGAGGVLQAALFSEDVARVPGLLQRLDARAKVVALVGLLIGVGLVHHVSVLLVAYLVTLALARASRAPARVLRAARVAVHPDLHRDHRAAGHARRDHAGRGRDPAAVRSRHHAPGTGGGGDDHDPRRDVDLARAAGDADDAVGAPAGRRPRARRAARVRARARDGLPVPVRAARGGPGHVRRPAGARDRAGARHAAAAARSSAPPPAPCSARPTCSRTRCTRR